MKIKLLSFVLASGILLGSCKKSDTVDPADNKSVDEITAPSTFMWSGSRDVSLSIGISDNAFGNQIHVIRVYNADPVKGGELVTTGSATLITPFNTKFTLPSTIREVYIQKVNPNGAVVSQTLALTSDNMSASISATGISSAISGKVAYTFNKAVSVISETSPNCTTGCTTTGWSFQDNKLQLTSSGVYCITAAGTTINAGNIDGGTIRVCAANVTINDLKLNGGTTLIIATGGSVTLNSNFGLNGVGHIKNFGTLTAQGNVQFNSGGSLYNEGTMTIGGDLYATSATTITTKSSLTVNGNTTSAATVFDNTGTLTLRGSKQFQNSTSSFVNAAGATANFNTSNNTTFEGTVTNQGTLTFEGGEININSGNPVVNNTGTFTANNSKLNHSTGTFTNGGAVRIRELNQNSNGKIINNCNWLVLENASSISAPIDNYSYFRVQGSINVNSNGVITLYNGAKFRAGSIQALNVVAVGAGSTASVFKVDNNLDGNMINDGNNNNSGANAKFSGLLQVDLNTSTYPLNATQPYQGNSSYVAYVNGLPVGFFKNGAVRMTSSNAVYIPSSTCMVEGNGTAPTTPVNTDPDGDGVHGADDKYPNDPTKAYIILSENYVNGGSTVAFEDNWPLKGDYDLNDVVINYKYKIITNAQNKVVRVEADYKLLATGGEFSNGAGIEFPILANQVANFTGITGTSLESGQTKAVVILFQNSRAEQATWNTQTSQATSPAKDYAIAFDVVNGPDQASFGVSNFNPFIWNNSVGFGRGYETHLFGKTPTSKANTALFGTGQDATNPNAIPAKYYGTATNLPWAITLPIANFKYPLERMPITDGYLKFSNWATSGGTSSLDWYSSTAAGYRVPANLY